MADDHPTPPAPRRLIARRRLGGAQVGVGVLGLGGLVATWWAGYPLAWIPIIVATELASRWLASREARAKGAR